MRISFIFLAIFVFFVVFPHHIFAVYDPLSVPNNKYGIHIIDENDLENAAKLVNSSGGEWGYVTVVITENDRNLEKWQKIMDRMYDLKLIPVIRLATTLEGNSWKKPQLSDALTWAEFLNKLKWVIQNRYVILFNEPNHANEWGGEIDPIDYADIVSSFSASLKKKSDNFFVLPAGLDASAPTSYSTMDEVAFLKKIIYYKPEIFDQIDGWTSHSYPNPGFKGDIDDSGRGSLRTYIWELDLLKKIGVKNVNLPVFITETGWPHQDGIPINSFYYSSEKVAELISHASVSVWNDSNIVAVTPFVLNYQSYPFSNFSWQKPDSNEFYPQYNIYQSIPKLTGQPRITSKELTDEVLGTNIRTVDVFDSQQTKKDRFINNKPWENFLNFFLKFGILFQTSFNL